MVLAGDAGISQQSVLESIGDNEIRQILKHTDWVGKVYPKKTKILCMRRGYNTFI